MIRRGLTMRARFELHARELPPFQKIADAVQTTGLSAFFLRNGCRDGTIPHIRSGRVLYVNVPALLKQLDDATGGDGRADD